MSLMKTTRRKKDLVITGAMAKWYDKNYRTTRLAEMHELAGLACQTVPTGASVLEIAPGPGYLSIELAKRGYTVTGVELSADFVEIEKRNAREEGVQIRFLQGNAADLPLLNTSFDFIVCSAAFKNFREPLRALREMHRVLKPGGTALIVDMDRNATKEDIEDELRRTGMKGFDRWFVKLLFRTFLRKGAYSRKEFESLIGDTVFDRHEIRKNGIGFQVWMYRDV